MADWLHPRTRGAIGVITGNSIDHAAALAMARAVQDVRTEMVTEGTEDGMHRDMIQIARKARAELMDDDAIRGRHPEYLQAGGYACRACGRKFRTYDGWQNHYESKHA